MPIYEFRCRECGAAFEALVRARDGDSAPACRACAGPTERLFSSFAARTPQKTRVEKPVSRNRPGRRVELPPEVARPAVELGSPPPLPEPWVRQLKEHGHC
jgi:putative FmdB family regulatory protein